MESSRTVFIYGLNDPRTGKCRYVGKASNCRKRWQAHLDRCRGRATHKNCWIKGLLLAGLKPILEILDEVPDSEWQFWEREYIRVFRAIGFDLTNALPGGEGLPAGHEVSEETKQKMAQAQRGRKHSEETKAKIRRSALVLNPMRGRKARSPAQIAANASRVGKPIKPFSLEHRRNLSISKLGKPGHPQTEASRELMRGAAKNRLRDPATGCFV